MNYKIGKGRRKYCLLINMQNLQIWSGINLDWAYGDLLNHIRLKVNCPHRAKDVLHDAIIRFAICPNAQKNQHPRAYLGTIVDNIIVDHARHQFFQADYINNYLDTLAFTHEPSAEELADFRQRITLLNELIYALPPRCRQAFWLYRVEGLSQKEIASKLNISLNMVERHMIRALLELKAAKSLFI